MRTAQGGSLGGVRMGRGGGGGRRGRPGVATSAQTHLSTLATQEDYFKEEIAAPRSQREDVYDNDGSVTHPSKTNKGEVLGRHGRS